MGECKFYGVCTYNYKYFCRHIEQLTHAHCIIMKEREDYIKNIENKLEAKRKKDLDRQLELETIAKNKYCESVSWVFVIDMLSEDDKEEYLKLRKKGGF